MRSLQRGSPERTPPPRLPCLCSADVEDRALPPSAALLGCCILGSPAPELAKPRWLTFGGAVDRAPSRIPLVLGLHPVVLAVR